MSHLEVGVLQKVVDGELAADGRAEAVLHLSTCRLCQEELAALRADTARASALMGMLEQDVPVEAAHAAFVRRRRHAAASAPAGRSGVLARWGGNGARQTLLRAAALLLTVTGVAVASVPGSPVREWITGVVVSQREAAAPELAPDAPAVVEAPVEERAPTGVYVSPEEGRIRIVLSAPSPELHVRTRLTTETRAEVYATGEAAGARFRTGPGRVEVIAAGPGELEVALPVSATAAYVEVNGRVYVAKEGQRLRVFAPHATGTPAEPVFRVGD
jgi:anti-sigma factor RsiW